MRVCVFCGSRPGNDSLFSESADRLGAVLAENGHTLIFGGGSGGLMGRTALAAKRAGGYVVGIIPNFLAAIEKPIENLDELHYTDELSGRKNLMYTMAEAFIVLPGGIGTLDEMTEIIGMRRLKLHDKPVILYDPTDYWQPWLASLHNAVACGFTDDSLLQCFKVIKDLSLLPDLLKPGR